MKSLLVSLLSSLLLIAGLGSAPASADIARNIVFPVIGPASFTNDFGAPRTGHTHEGNDIFAAKMQPLVAAATGTITLVNYPQASWGWAVFIRDADGYQYRYIHLNNDSPGTDDGNGGPMLAYAPDMTRGNNVVAGQLIGFNGDSGNAENTPPHLHFEIRAPDGTPLNPYDALRAAPRLSAPVEPPPLPNETLPYGSFRGGASVASGNFDADPEVELVTGAGPGGGPHVRTFDVTSTLSATLKNNGFFAYDPGFKGGIDVAAGDVDGDGIDEIITGAGRGGGPHVQVFSAEGERLSGFFAFDVGFTGGVKVSAGDMDDDGNAEIVVGAGPGGGPHVRIFEANGTLLDGFFPYNPGFSGGVDVAVGDVRGDSDNEVITGAGAGGGPHVRIFEADGSLVDGFFPYEVGFTGGVRVSAGDVRTRSNLDEIVTAPWSSGGPHARLFDSFGTELSGRFPFDIWWTGGYDVTAARGSSFVTIASTGRRASMRAGPR